MEAALYVHPQDLLPDAGGRLMALRDLGVQEISVAMAYHAGRLTRGAGPPAVLELEDGVVYFRPDGAAGPVRPRTGALVPGEGDDALDRIVDGAGRAGLRVTAWTVFFHNTPLATAHADLAIENALGDRMAYALCPARSESRRYAEALAGALGRRKGLYGIEIEALGFMGYRHGSHHDKSSFRLDAEDDFLLSLCFCRDCGALLARGGLDPAALRSEVAEIIAERLFRGDVLAPRPAGGRPLPETLVLGLRRAAILRAEIVTETLSCVRAAVGSRVRLLGMIEPDLRYTGSAMALPLDAVSDLDELVLTQYGRDRTAREAAFDALGAVPLTCRTWASFWPRRPEFADWDEFAAAVRHAARRGAVGIRVYHGGLLPGETLRRAVEIVRAGGGG